MVKPTKRIVYRKAKVKHKHFKHFIQRLQYVFAVIKEMEDEEYGK